MATNKRNALGRGLDSLISMDDVPAKGSSAINEIPLELISANPDQPRTTFDENSLAELAVSIKELGIIQPLSLRKTGPNSYQIIAGERRFRAARLAGLESVPAYIRTANDAELTEMALIENIQREDLNAIEIALTFKKLLDTYNMTQEKLSERVGKKRATIANFLRLLRLPAEVQLGLRDRAVDMGHARALLSIDNPSLQLKLYNRILKEGLSVRKVEELAKAIVNKTDEPKKPAVTTSAKEFRQLERNLSTAFNTDVKLKMNGAKGNISFTFNDEAQLQQLLAMFDTIKLRAQE